MSKKQVKPSKPRPAANPIADLYAEANIVMMLLDNVGNAPTAQEVIDFGVSQSVSREDSKTIFRAWNDKIKISQELGQFALDAARLGMREQIFKADVLSAAYDIKLENPQDMRDHFEDIRGLSEATGKGVPNALLNLLVKMEVLGLDVTKLMTEGLALYPDEFAQDGEPVDE